MEREIAALLVMSAVVTAVIVALFLRRIGQKGRQ